MENQDHETGTAPDLARGTLLNGIGGPNQWVTEIQCALFNGHDESWTYLAHECRAEDVPYCEGVETSGDGIFQRGRSLEFLTYKTGSRTYQLSHHEHIVSDGLLEDRTAFPGAMDLTGSCDSEARCPERPIRYLTVEAVVDGLRDGSLDLRSTFLEVAWEEDRPEGRIPFRLYCPCRYVNFPAGDQESGPYVQPISGYVLYPDKDRFVQGYVACAFGPGRETLIEFCGRRYGNVFTRATQMPEVPDAAHPVLENLGKALPLGTSSLDLTLPLNGEARIYRYRE